MSDFINTFKKLEAAEKQRYQEGLKRHQEYSKKQREEDRKFAPIMAKMTDEEKNTLFMYSLAGSMTLDEQTGRT